MPDIPGWVIEILKYGGMPALMFLIWYFYHAAQAKQWVLVFEGMQQAQKERNELDEKKSLRDYELLKNTIETVSVSVAILSRIENKIDTGQTCKVGGIAQSMQSPFVPQISTIRS